MRHLRGAGELPDDPQPTATRQQLEAWVLSTLPRALGYANSLLRDRSLADDVVHDCYLRLLQKAHDYDLLRDGTRLLYKAMTNACVDRNHRERMVLSLHGTTTEESGSDAAAVASGQSGPLEEVLQHELEHALEEEVARLPMAQRAALELVSLGYSLQEVAESLGTSASNAGVLVFRARKTLARRLESYMGSRSDERTRRQSR